MPFDLQGHRGARGLKPENTLPSFEVALDLGVTSVEFDVVLTKDEIPVIFHDFTVTNRICRLSASSTVPDPAAKTPIGALSLQELRQYRADQNPDRERFPTQDNAVTPLAKSFAHKRGFDPFAPPALADLFAFVEAYAAASSGKGAVQRDRARRLRFDLELKREPFSADGRDSPSDPSAPGALERQVIEIVRASKVLDRTIVRSFDHRSVLAVRRAEPRLGGAVLVDGTAPIHPARLAHDTDATTYCPDYHFLDRAQVRALHGDGVRVVPWTVNDPDSWTRLIDWEVDGITTDFPDQLAGLLRQRGIDF